MSGEARRVEFAHRWLAPETRVLQGREWHVTLLCPFCGKYTERSVAVGHVPAYECASRCGARFRRNDETGGYISVRP